MNDKSEIFLVDGRSFVVHQPAVELAEQLSEQQKGASIFSSIPTTDGINVYLNPQYVVSITDYSYPEEDFSHVKEAGEQKQSEQTQKDKEAYNERAAKQFKKEIDNME